jgi:6,7-dimethyl-8-ribityllumazine synthase
VIKSIHKLIVAPSAEQYAALRDFFTALGLSSGETWEGGRSRGAKFEAPSAGVEIGFGQGFPDAEVVIETDDLDGLYLLCRERKSKVISKPADQEWGARLFIAEASPGLRIAFFAYREPPPERNVLEGELRGAGKRFAIVASRFNSFITERLLTGAREGLRRTGVSAGDVEVIRVPGSFEIPAAAHAAAQTGRFAAIICLGCLLRGETAHYEVLANEVARGIGQSAQETAVPHAFGVLTCDTVEQAIGRAGLKQGNKGFEAALAAVEMADLKNRIIGRPEDRII